MFFFSLGLGNIPGNTTPTSLQNLFTKYGNIESVRVLSHKNCGFINFELVESAMAARDALLQNEIGVQGFTSARVGFAKIPAFTPPPPPSTTTNNKTTTSNSSDAHSSAGSAVSSVDGSSSLLTDATNDWQNDLCAIMSQFNLPIDSARTYVKGKKKSIYLSCVCLFILF